LPLILLNKQLNDKEVWKCIDLIISSIIWRNTNMLLSGVSQKHVVIPKQKFLKQAIHAVLLSGSLAITKQIKWIKGLFGFTSKFRKNVSFEYYRLLDSLQLFVHQLLIERQKPPKFFWKNGYSRPILPTIWGFIQQYSTKCYLLLSFFNLLSLILALAFLSILITPNNYYYFSGN